MKTHAMEVHINPHWNLIQLRIQNIYNQRSALYPYSLHVQN